MRDNGVKVGLDGVKKWAKCVKMKITRSKCGLMGLEGGKRGAKEVKMGNKVDKVMLNGANWG